MTIEDDDDPVETFTFPVESPLQVTYDANSGELSIDSAVLHNEEGPSPVMLRLNFSADATHKFVCMLREVEEQMSITMDGRPQLPRVQ
jgi:hypothetical protein